MEPPFDSRENVSHEAKLAIAARAVSLLSADETVVLDSGTTVLELARCLRGSRVRLTVVTPSLPAAMAIAPEPEITVLMPGGEVRPGELSLVGGSAEEGLGQFNTDTIFLSTAGLDLDRGLTDYNLDEARMKRAALRTAGRIVALIDKTKLNRVYLATVFPASELDVLITDAAEDDPTVRSLRGSGVEVLTVTASP